MLQIRYHSNFKTKNTLLFAGTGDDLRLLRKFFMQWTGEELDLIQHFQSQEKVYLSSVTALQLQRDAKRDVFTWYGNKGTWAISQRHQNIIIGLLDGLLRTNSAGHQYLYDGGDPVQIMAAKDEYPLPPSVGLLG